VPRATSTRNSRVAASFDAIVRRATCTPSRSSTCQAASVGSETPGDRAHVSGEGERRSRVGVDGENESLAREVCRGITRGRRHRVDRVKLHRARST
jgi:hypothetical protein